MTQTTESRIRAAWQARACAAGVCVGAQVFLLGTGVAMPLCLNGAWIAALAALPAAALITLLCHRALRRRCAAGRPFSLPHSCSLLLCCAFVLCASFSAAAQICLAEHTLLPQARSAWSAAVTVLFLSLAALSGGAGVSRFCFAIRFLLPAALLALSAASLPLSHPDGIFPFLGSGVPPLAAASLCMPSAAVPALLLLLPPAQLQAQDRAAQQLPPPPARFFLLRVLAGAGVGVLLILMLCAGSTHESIAALGAWGERLRIASSAKPHEGVAQALLILSQMIACSLLSVSMLCAGAEALRAAYPRLGRLSAVLPCALLAAALCLLLYIGFSRALSAAPLLFLPAGAALMIHRRWEKGLP